MNSKIKLVIIPRSRTAEVGKKHPSTPELLTRMILEEVFFLFFVFFEERLGFSQQKRITPNDS